jgi:enamine deaminase RidA (YjgF/YER057c/UK114 family)
MENIITCIMVSSAIVKFSGQGGWDETGKLEVNNLEHHVDLAFKNVDRVLQAAALRGWEVVYSVRSYHVDMSTSFNRAGWETSSQVTNLTNGSLQPHKLR